jgi:hypothetical protein
MIDYSIWTVEAMNNVTLHRNSSTLHVYEFFAWGHLPGHLAEVSRPFWNLAFHLIYTLEDSPELTAALRKLLEAKDCAVRAAL